MNSACDTVVHCVSVESKICIPRKGFSQSEYKMHSSINVLLQMCYVCAQDNTTEYTFHGTLLKNEIGVKRFK